MKLGTSRAWTPFRGWVFFCVSEGAEVVADLILCSLWWSSAHCRHAGVTLDSDSECLYSGPRAKRQCLGKAIVPAASLANYSIESAACTFCLSSLLLK